MLTHQHHLTFRARRQFATVELFAMKCTIHSLHAYRGALVLNNLGVTLIERGFYEDALVTLRDGVTAMRYAVRPNPFHPIGLSVVQEALHRAYARLQVPDRGNALCSALQSVSFECSVIPFPANPEQSSWSIESFLRPTRIDIPSFVCDPSERDPDLETSLILCNFALSHYLLSTTIQDLSAMGELLEDSLRVFDLVSLLLDNRFAVCHDSMEEASLMTVGLHLTGNVLNVLRRCGQDDLASLFADKYHLIVECMRHNQVVAWCQTHGALAAAPAA